MTSEETNELIAALPAGDVQYCIGTINGHDCWDVVIFTPGSVHRIATVATGMDKSTACWLMHKLIEARK